MDSVTGDDRHAYERGMILDIYANPSGNFSNGGVSSRCTQVTVVHVIDMTDPTSHALRPVPRDCRVFAPTALRPPAALVIRQMGRQRLLHVTPIDAESVSRAMMGGCYVATSDSRWARCVEEELGGSFYGALALHDRWEG